MNKYYIVLEWRRGDEMGRATFTVERETITEAILKDLVLDIQGEFNYSDVIITNWKKLDE